MSTKIKAIYDKDTFRCHRYLIKEAEGIKGSLYIDKEAEIPEEITIILKAKEQ